ncbi:serine/threonine protein kinase [Fonticula alba]|uniref:Serine/threonine protein kinase n=1 Tax=Fonticula alba TaxID=691883 RepID=A0A058Z6R6_FONAL|nr:serine/threonine protein kinase [Fonticula alba]KCV69816.1 serine/threonine protein kinase [Fonticula alba]|eukprot:XP_009495422.1 serine/threonine protein kinase [Fonticula alba]
MIHPARGQSGRRQVGLTAGFLLLALLGSLALLLTCSAWRSGPASGTVAASCPQFCIDCPNQVCQGCSDGRYLHMADSANPCVVTCPPDYPTIYDNMGVLICFPESIEGCSMMRLSDDFYCVECKPGRWISEGRLRGGLPVGHLSQWLDMCPLPGGLLPLQRCVYLLGLRAGVLPQRQLLREADRQCEACDASCHTCEGPTEAQCLSCAGKTGALLDGHCLSSCPLVGFWLDESDPLHRVCRPCGEGCDRCSDATSCLTCKPGLVLLHSGPGGASCVSDCPGGFFASLLDGQSQAACAACAPDCLTCTGPERRDCQVYACETDGTCGPPRNRSLVIGLAVGLSLLLLILLLILLVLLWALRRRRRVPKEEADTDMTVLNTVMDLSLPGFLLLSFQEDLRVTGDAASSGTQGGIFPAEPLKPELITAAGDSSIVVKLLSAEPSPSLAEAHVQAMFENELSILWALQQSPNVVRMLGYTQAPRAIVMVREATDLDSLLGSDSPLDAANALALVRGMALGLGFIHAQGIAHRDIKSANVLVGPCPETGAMRPAFADFGVAMAVSRGSALLDSAMVLACSVSFAAPEVLASMDAGGLGAAPIDHLAADVYSLASVFWHILTQTRPWSGLSKDRIQDLLGSGRTPASHGPAAREDLLQEPALGSLASGLLADMWATDPGRRPGISSVAMSLSE